MSLIHNFLKTNSRCRRKFYNNMLWKGWLGFRKFKKRKERGELFPAFHFISVTNNCNLRCQGCWVSDNGKSDNLDVNIVHSVIESGKKQGSYFYGILGGEPLIYNDLFEIFEKHSDCYFQLFTNGTLLTDEVAERLREAANVTVAISFEGDEEAADIRRGGKNVYQRTVSSIDTSVKHGLITGVAISVCKSNIEMALSDDFIMMLHNRGVVYVWYYIYRPAGERPSYELALDNDDILRLRKFLVEGRNKYPIAMVDSYWRADGEPFCPAAEGLSHHINAAGYIEPCPVIQLSRDMVTNSDLKSTYENSSFLRDFRHEILHKTKGCVLMEDPSWLSKFAERQRAINTSNRPGMLSAFMGAPEVCSHGSCKIIPERNIIYRFAKKTAFFGLGAYG